MPIDEKYTEPMFGSLRAMVQKCREEHIDGEDFNVMKAALKRMEELADEMNDFGDYFDVVQQEDLINKFSNSYGNALSSKFGKQ